ncbi:MAG: TIM barrel protein [Saprospiraceae bacterium]|nr:TIM barrel protein [Saprospiraceae bacterium]
MSNPGALNKNNIIIPRRYFIRQLGVIAALPLTDKLGKAVVEEIGDDNISLGYTVPQMSYHIFSKHINWMSFKEMAQLAKRIGFDGIDLTVRKGGLIEPEHVKTNLPIAVETIRKEGIDVKCLSTDLGEQDDQHTSDMLSTMKDLEITHFRMKNFHYHAEETYKQSQKRVFENFKKLAKRNEKYKIIGSYQNHSNYNGPGVAVQPYFGANLLDVYLILSEIESPYLGMQFDIDHATVEGAYSWKWAFDLIHPYLTSLHIKDHTFIKGVNGLECPQVPIGTGLVDYEGFADSVKKFQLKVPVTFYYGYDIGNKELGLDEAAMFRDLNFLKSILGA